MYSSVGTWLIFKSHRLAVSIMKSNSVIVRTYTWEKIFIRLTFFEMRNWLHFVIHRVSIAMFFNCPVLNMSQSLLVLLYSDEHWWLIYLFIYYVIFTQEYPISAEHCSPWGSCITCMTKQTSISIHSVIIQWLHWLRGTYIITCITLTTYTCSSLQWLHAGIGSCLVNIMYLINVTFNIHYTTSSWNALWFHV